MPSKRFSLLSLLLLAAPAAWAQDLPDLETLVQQAIVAHPDLEAAKARDQAVDEMISVAGAPADPMLSLTAVNIPTTSFDLASSPMSGFQIGLAQKRAPPGSLRSARESATQRSEAAAAGTEELANRLALAVRTTYADLHQADVQIQVVEENLQRMDDIAELARSRYRVGTGLLQSPLKASAASDAMRLRLQSLERRRTQLAARMNALLARPEDAPIANLATLSLDPLPPLPRTEVLMGKARQTRPWLQALDATARAADADAETARREVAPDITLQAGFRLRDPGLAPAGAQMITLGASVPLPVHAGARDLPLARAAERQAEASRSDRASAELTIYATVEDALSQIQHLVEELTILKDRILPTLQSALEADRSAYSVDRIAFEDLLRVENDLLENELRLHTLHAERDRQLARLANAVGLKPDQLFEVSP